MGLFRLRRRQWLVDKQHQLPFASLLLIEVCALIMALGLFAYIVNRRTMRATLELISDQQARLVASQPLYEASQEFLLRVLVVVGLTALVQILFGIYTSHKLAGPVLKMRRLMAEIESGRPVTRMVFRRGDYLDELADVLNRLTAPIEARRLALNRTVPGLEAELEALRAGLERGELPGPRAGELGERITRLVNEYGARQPGSGGSS